MSTVSDALEALTDLQPDRARITADILRGLSLRPRQLPSKYFYDARGSALFEQITRQPEYYPTRTELQLLRTARPTSHAWSARACMWSNLAVAVGARPNTCCTR